MLYFGRVCSSYVVQRNHTLINISVKNKEFSCFQTLKCVILHAKNVKMPTIVGILTFMCMINLMLSWVEHFFFYNLRAWLFHYIFSWCCGLLQCEETQILLHQVRKSPVELSPHRWKQGGRLYRVSSLICSFCEVRCFCFTPLPTVFQSWLHLFLVEPVVSRC